MTRFASERESQETITTWLIFLPSIVLAATCRVKPAHVASSTTPVTGRPSAFWMVATKSTKYASAGASPTGFADPGSTSLLTQKLNLRAASRFEYAARMKSGRDGVNSVCHQILLAFIGHHQR